MLARSQLFSLVRCSRLGCEAYYKPKQKLAVWAIRSTNPRPLGQAIPEYFNFSKDVLDHWSQQEKVGPREPYPALWEVNAKGMEKRWSFGMITHFSPKAANILSDICTLSHGDRLMILLPPASETYCIYLACVRLGIVFVPGPAHLTAKEVLYRLNMSKAQCIVVNGAMVPVVDSIASNCPTLKTKLLVSDKRYAGWLDFKELLRVALPKPTCVETKSQDPMVFFFTNKTTGTPKLVEYTQYGLGMILSQVSRQWMDFQRTDVLWSLGDLFGGTLSLSNILGAWLQGTCVFLHHMPTFCPETVLKALSRFPITTLSGTKGMYQELLQHHSLTRYRFKNLKYCMAAGESINPEMIENWKRVFKLDIYEGYGLTETGLLCATSKKIKLKPGSLGKPVSPYVIQIVDENSNILSPGEESNIAIHVQLNQPAYHYCPHMVSWEDYASARGHMLYLTGDRGIMDEDGYFWWTEVEVDLTAIKKKKLETQYPCVENFLDAGKSEPYTENSTRWLQTAEAKDGSSKRQQVATVTHPQVYEMKEMNIMPQPTTLGLTLDFTYSSIMSDPARYPPLVSTWATDEDGIKMKSANI
ncbi:acyl-coenzyme A synthetase ACSM6, mitochondrial [Tenrec ecaudatus]|uniref:acyl-coenzyme A synthetase ACSM6, mitochondrial n=1 Tax=Tenrec ecaudatus TaxID=94439 RepID=UPI003F594A88